MPFRDDRECELTGNGVTAPDERHRLLHSEAHRVDKLLDDLVSFRARSRQSAFRVGSRGIATPFADFNRGAMAFLQHMSAQLFLSSASRASANYLYGDFGSICYAIGKCELVLARHRLAIVRHRAQADWVRST